MNQLHLKTVIQVSEAFSVDLIMQYSSLAKLAGEAVTQNESDESKGS